MKNFLLSVVLIALPVALFATGYKLMPGAATAPTQAVADGPSLGDMSAFTAIVSDVQTISTGGDLVAAGKRITDFETAWDDAQKTLRPINTGYWGNVDDAADAALSALRAATPDPAEVKTTLASLLAELADPSLVPGGANATGAPGTVAGIVTTDANGRALPCEVMLETFRSKLTAARLSDEQHKEVVALQAKGTERCNADDDKRAGDFFAQGLALMNQ
jgi:hypothetical protein